MIAERIISEKLKALPIENLPTGLGSELDRRSQCQPGKYKVICRSVPNSVVMLNTDFPDLPFNIEPNQQTPLGLYAYSASGEGFAQGHALEFWPAHHRSAILGRVIIADKQERLYRDIDVKGIGTLFGDQHDFGWDRHEYNFVLVYCPGRLKQGTREREGFLCFQDAINDCKMSEEFLKAGIRTHRVIALIRPDMFFSDRQGIYVHDAVQKDILSSEYEPVIAVRAFGTRARISDLNTDIDKQLVLKDTLTLLQQELNLEDPFSPNQYLLWFAKTLGINVGLMIKNDWSHHCINGHNVTLDCRIVDLDTVTKIKSRFDIDQDVRDSEETLKELCSYIEKSLTERCVNLFFEAFRIECQNSSR